MTIWKAYPDDDIMVNKSYPIVLGPMLEKDELKTYFLKFLSYYYNGIEELDEEEIEVFE